MRDLSARLQRVASRLQHTDDSVLDLETGIASEATGCRPDCAACEVQHIAFALDGAPEDVDAAVDEVKAMIAEQESSLRFREEEGTLDVLPAFHGIDPTDPKRKRRIDVDEDVRYGERHRTIAAKIQRRLDALRIALNALAVPPCGEAVPRDWQQDDAVQRAYADCVSSLRFVKRTRIPLLDALCNAVASLPLPKAQQ